MVGRFEQRVVPSDIVFGIRFVRIYNLLLGFLQIYKKNNDMIYDNVRIDRAGDSFTQ